MLVNHQLTTALQLGGDPQQLDIAPLRYSCAGRVDSRCGASDSLAGHKEGSGFSGRKWKLSVKSVGISQIFW